MQVRCTLPAKIPDQPFFLNRQACIGAEEPSGLAGPRSKIVGVANDGSGGDEHRQSPSEAEERSAAGTYPFGQRYSPARTRDEVARDVESPTRELILSDFRLVLVVVDELEVRGCAGGRGKKKITQEGL